MEIRSAGAGVRTAAVVLFGLASAAAQAQTAAMTNFEMKQYTGKWFELARLPDKAQKKCESDAIVLYAEGDKKGRFQFVASCRVKDGTTDVHNESGRAEDKLGDGKLQLRLWWPFWTKYWVLAVGPPVDSSYGWALVGTPNHKKLWILSRQATLDAATLDQIRAKASAEGFDPAKLIVVPQSPAAARAVVGR